MTYYELHGCDPPCQHDIIAEALNQAAGYAPHCDGWHSPTNGHCGDCGCIACHLATHR